MGSNCGKEPVQHETHPASQNENKLIDNHFLTIFETLKYKYIVKIITKIEKYSKYIAVRKNRNNTKEIEKN